MFNRTRFLVIWMLDGECWMLDHAVFGRWMLNLRLWDVIFGCGIWIWMLDAVCSFPVSAIRSSSAPSGLLGSFPSSCVLSGASFSPSHLLSSNRSSIMFTDLLAYPYMKKRGKQVNTPEIRMVGRSNVQRRHSSRTTESSRSGMTIIIIII